MSLSQQIDIILANAIERRVFPGAVVLIAEGECIRHYQAYGTTMYGAAGSRPVRLDTIYDVASLTKMFTATAALRLGDAGALDLDAPVAAYLPGFRAPAVTIRHLLTHTSGLDIRLSALRHAGRDALLETAYHLKPVQPPGSIVAYTNVNSLLLGDIVGRVHGAGLDQALHDLVIAPLRLLDTCFCPPSELKSRIAPTEVDEAWRGGLVHGSVHDESAHALGGIAGHAGLFSSAADINRFCSAWLAAADRSLANLTWAAEAPFLRPETARRAMTNQTPGLSVACGLGWMIDRPNFMGPAPVGIVGHTGFTGPAMAIARASRIVVVVLSNRVYPQRAAPAHHAVTSVLVSAALSQLPNADTTTPQARPFVV
jgi:CubicO group peptidase (beta-lactamase class C family)